MGPLSASEVSLRSQRERLDTLLTEVGARSGDPVTLEGDAAKRVRSGLTYLLNHHGPEGLPDWVQERWAEARERDNLDLDVNVRRHFRYAHTQQVLTALNLTLFDEGGLRHWYRIQSEGDPIALAPYQTLYFGRIGETDGLPFRLDHELRVFVGDEEIAKSERDRFAQALDTALQGQPMGTIDLPHEQLSMVISFEGEVFTIIFQFLYVRRHEGEIEFGRYGAYYLILKQQAP